MQGASICSDVSVEQTISRGAGRPHRLHWWFEGVQVQNKSKEKNNHQIKSNKMQHNILWWCTLHVCTGLCAAQQYKACVSTQRRSRCQQNYSPILFRYKECKCISRIERDSRWLWSLKQESTKPLLSSLNNLEFKSRLVHASINL